MPKRGLNGAAAVDPSAAIGELVIAHPARAEVFERLRLDYCCNGGQTLAQACERRGLDVGTVCQMLEALEDLPLAPESLECRDWRPASISELCDHIVAAHHDRLRAQMPRIDELLATVVRVHGAQHAELHDLQRLFASARDELVAHMEAEERVVFPLCRAAEAGRGPVDEALLAVHESEHAETGDALVALRELSHDYDPDAALCRTHRSLLEELHRFELDLHQHVHEENNILFSRARALVARAPGA
ncbi:MAG: iron-sulfur cluster repair di-iron protein [Solirubrobacteraceae bacterium]